MARSHRLRGATFNTYRKYGPTHSRPEPHWYEFLFDGTLGAEIRPDRILLHVKNDELGDEDAPRPEGRAEGTRSSSWIAFATAQLNRRA